MNYKPVYLKTYKNGILHKKVDDALGLLEDCKVCPRDCHVNRRQGEYAAKLQSDAV